MKTLHICIPTGLLFIITLLLVAYNVKPAIEYQYGHCVKNLMQNYELASEQEALDKFEELAIAKAKILQADSLLDQVNRIGEGPVARSVQESPKKKHAFAKQLQKEARQLLLQLEGQLLASN